MAIKRTLAIIPLVVPFAGAQNAILDALKQNAGRPPITAISGSAAAIDTTTNDSTTETTAEEEQTVTAPEYDEEQCDSWIKTLAAADADGSGGVSGVEYLTFLSGINNPPYVGDYFQDSTDYSSLPWTFRVIHKTLSCHCQQLDMGPKCCEGDKAEVLILGLGDATQQTRDTTQEEYRDMFCQHISYAVSRSVPSPAPTENPTYEPTPNPTVSTTPAPSPSPVTPEPTVSPIPGATPAPTPEPTQAPSPEPTVLEQNVQEVQTPQPTDVLAAVEVAPQVAAASTPEEKDEGLGVGGIIGIIVGILIALLAIIAMVAYRRKVERDRLRLFAGDQAPEADLEAPPPAMDGPGLDPAPMPADEPSPGDNPDEDDESSAPSVWSQSDDEDTAPDMHDANEEERVTAGSALAAMGAASTVAANLMHQPSGNSDESGVVEEGFV